MLFWINVRPVLSHIFDRDPKSVELDFPASTHCFSYNLLQQFLRHMEETQEHILELGNG